MEHLSQRWHIFGAALLLTLLLLPNSQSDATATAKAAGNTTDERRIVKKDQALPPPLPPAQDSAEQQAPGVASATEKVVVISEKPLQLSPVVGQNGHQAGVLPQEDVHIEHSNIGNNDDFPDTYATVFYVLVGITSSAIFLLVLRIYRLRLSRAERKYGVQGDRANQELTPLPMAIEDVNSDEEEDHTLFEVNRQSIRIL